MADAKPKFTKQAAEAVVGMLNRADELGGEVRDYLQDQIATNPRYVAARKRLAGLFGRRYESRAEVTAAAAKVEAKKAAVAAPTPVKVNPTGFGNAAVKAQIYGKKSCPWTGRAITLLERHKVDFDYLDLEEPEHEGKAVGLANETHQHTVPYVYLRGQFIGGFNALAEIERLGQLDFALMTAEERANVPAHQRVEVVSRPNTDEAVPAEADPGS
jgi:glutaredoxin